MRVAALALVALALVAAVSARQHAHPKAHHKLVPNTKHHAVEAKRHHKNSQHMEFDLERLSDSHRRTRLATKSHELSRDLEEEEEEEDESVSFLLAIDAGSSGSKIMVYRKSSATCPDMSGVSGGKLCDGKGVKIKPGLKRVLDSDTSVSEYFSAVRMAQQAFGGNDKFVGFLAKATAGNRIISKATNATAWDHVNRDFTTAFQLNAYATEKFGEPATMPGTMEAWMEFKAAKALDTDGATGGNFISLGGASAQMAFVLSNGDIAMKFKDLFSTMSTTNLFCNNQEKLEDFACVVENAPNEFNCLPWSAVESKCSGGQCVGLISWLAGKQMGDNTGCTITLSGGGHHRAGGTDQVKNHYKDWVQTHGSAHSSACKEGTTLYDCQKAIEAFIDGDILLATVNQFSKFYRDILGNAKWFSAGNMDTALNRVAPSVVTTTNLIKPNKEYAAFFVANAQALTMKAGVAAALARPAKKIDWLDSAASIAGFPEKCDLPITIGNTVRFDDKDSLDAKVEYNCFDER